MAPIFKKGKKTSAINYRPVSLTCITCKILEHIITSHIHSHLDRYDILSDRQHGFRSRRSCETQLLYTYYDLIQAKNSKPVQQVDMIILDMSKAFDKVSHPRLLAKCKAIGITGPVLSWIESWLGGRTQRVLLEGIGSNSAPVRSGVPQGSVLGPVLFLIFINDIISDISPGTSCRLFADDCLLYRPITSECDSCILQKDLQSLENWEEAWRMKFNSSKCKVLRIPAGRKVFECNYRIHNESLEIIKNEKYLGVYFSHDMKWNTHVDYIIKKANRNLHQA